MRPIKQPKRFHVAAALLLFALPLSAHALTPSEVFEQVKDSVFVVKSFDAKGEQNSLGSGVLLPSGKIATNCHVVKEGVSFQVGRGKQFAPATVFAGDEDKDICLLDAKVIGGKPAKVGKAASLKVGEPVYAVGAPQGLELSLSDGIVSQLRGGPPPFIQTTAAISPGSSGGGLFDGSARLVGFTTLYIEGGQSLNFAMPVEWLAEIKPGEKKTAKGRSETDWLKQALALNKREDWAGLRDWCRQWVKDDPKNDIAWFMLGAAYGDLKQHTEAVDAYREAVRINPKFASSWDRLGNRYSHLKQYTDAIDAHLQAIRIDSEDAYAWNNLGNAYGGLNRYTEAVDAYRQAIRINPKVDAIWNNLGNTYVDLKRHIDAIDAYRQAININPKNTSAWYNLGGAYVDISRHAEAIEAYRQAVRINPREAIYWNSLGSTYGDLNRHTEALGAFREAIRISPEDATYWNNIGKSYRDLKRGAESVDAFRHALRIDPKYAEAWFGLGNTYGDLERDNDAINAYREAIRIKPDYVKAWYNLGLWYELSGNRSAALEAVQTLRQLDSDRAERLFNAIVPR